MHQYNFKMRITAALILVFFAAGCVSMKPERFATPGEVYPSPDEYASVSNLSPHTYKKSVFEAPYQNVYRAVQVAARQLDFNIESMDKNKGVILATREFHKPPPANALTKAGMAGGQHKYFYLIRVKQLSKNETEITVIEKVQISCGYWGPVSFTFGSIFTLLILMPFMIIENVSCSNKAVVHWPDIEQSGMDTIAKLINQTGKNLLSAEAL